jgi:hypothetical protein
MLLFFFFFFFFFLTKKNVFKEVNLMISETLVGIVADELFCDLMESWGMYLYLKV